MAAPAVHATTRRVYDGLPEVYRHADTAQDFALLRYLSLVVDQLGAIVDLIDRIDYVAPDDPDYDPALDAWATSDLVDPAFADPGWLPWLATLVGVTLNPALDVPARRATIADASAGWQVGTRGAIVTAAQAVLTGTRSVRVRPTGPHNIDVITVVEETPGGPSSVVTAVETGRARPAGVIVTHTYYAAPWDTIEAAYATWTTQETVAPTWGDVEATT